MTRAKPRPVQIRHTLLDVEGLSSRVNPSKETIRYELMTRVLSSLKKWLTRTQTNDLTLFLLACKVPAIM